MPSSSNDPTAKIVHDETGDSGNGKESMIGRKVSVFWPLDEQWYVGVVQEYDASTGEHLLRYPDGDTEWVKIRENGSTMPAGPPTSQKNAGSPPSGRGGDRPDERVGGGGNPSYPPNMPPHGGAGGPPQLSPDMTKMRRPGYPDEPMGGPPPHFYGHPYPEMPPHFGSPYANQGGPYPHAPHVKCENSYSAAQQGYGYPANPNMHASPPRKNGPKGPEHTPSYNSTGSTEKLNSGSKRKSGPKTWTKEEDSQLLSMVQNMRMPMKWSLVAQSMPDRTGKQCRERYVNHLNPRLKNCDWSPMEDATIFHLYNTCGSQWAKMSKMIPGRTDNGIKNRFHNLRRQLEREDEHRIRLSKPEDFPDEVRLDRIRTFPEGLRGKCDTLWDMSDGIGVLAAQSVLGGSFARNAGRFGPFRKAVETGEQCARCGLYAPSVHTGLEICTKTGWCIACTRIPPHMCGNLLRECLNLRRRQDIGEEKVEETEEVKVEETEEVKVEETEEDSKKEKTEMVEA